MRTYQESLKAAILWLERLRNEPEDYYENLKFFNRYILEGNLSLMQLVTKEHPEGTSKVELEMLRRKHHVNGALLTLELISKMKKGDQVSGNPLFDLYQKELQKDMHAGHFTESFLSKLVESKRGSDYFAEKRTVPPLPPLGTPERKKEEERRDGCKKAAGRWLAKLREDKGMTEVTYQHYLHTLRIIMKAGYLTLQDVDPKATRAELDRLRPK